MTDNEEDQLMWETVHKISKQIDAVCKDSMREGFEDLLGPALIISGIRALRESGASDADTEYVLTRAIVSIDQEPIRRRKGFHVVGGSHES